MRLLRPVVPPSISVTTDWRTLWRQNAFTQSPLTWDTNLGASWQARGVSLGVGQDPFEKLDLKGAFSPIAFARDGDPGHLLDVGPFEHRMTFREEENARPWSDYRYDIGGHMHVAGLYSRWQLLYLNEVTARSEETVSLDVLAASAEDRERRLEQLRPLYEAHRADWMALDDAWRPLMKLLVRLQNRYLPLVTGTGTLLLDPETGEHVDPWVIERASFDPHGAAAELGLTPEQIEAAFQFLVERAVGFEPRDGMEMLRRGAPRSVRTRWQGDVRIAQDHYDAAQVLFLFFEDLTSAAPARTPVWPADGRQPYRAALYERGPVRRLERRELQSELVDVGLYPHAVHVVGEGRCEDVMVTKLVTLIIGSVPADDLGFTDLGGSGSASRLPTLVNGFTTYAQRTVVIADTEGNMQEHAEGLMRSGILAADDILLFDRNLEESNFADNELLRVLQDLGANPPPGKPVVLLTLTVEDVRREHAARTAKASEPPGLAGTLLRLALDPAHGGPLVVSKPDFAEVLAEHMVTEYFDAQPDEREGLLVRRPLLRFTFDRIVPPLQNRRWS